MNTQLPPKVARLLFVALLAVGGMPRALGDCDEPGTPNQEQLRSDGHGQLIYSFENTARVSPGARGCEMGKVTIYFDMNMGDGNNPNGNNWTYIEGAGPYQLCNYERVTLAISTSQTQQVNPANRRNNLVDRPLVVGKKHCSGVSV